MYISCSVLFAIYIQDIAVQCIAKYIAKKYIFLYIYFFFFMCTSKIFLQPALGSPVGLPWFRAFSSHSFSGFIFLQQTDFFCPERCWPAGFCGAGPAGLGGAPGGASAGSQMPRPGREQQEGFCSAPETFHPSLRLLFYFFWLRSHKSEAD